MKGIKDFDKIMISLASPDQIRAWSYGEVKKPETINYRTLRPEKDGLFCERIFGTTKEWECYCGKFKSARYKGVVCDRCGVEVNHFRVRRERMGHIELAAPMSHIWYYRTVPSRIGLLLDISLNVLRSILYYEKYIVTDPGETDFKKMDVLTEEEYEKAKTIYGYSFGAGIGAEVIQHLLENLDLDRLFQELRQKMVESKKVDARLLKRLEIVNAFRESRNKPAWMILTALPVIPPDLRPMVQLEGGRFASSDLNDLYRRIINRNNRLKRLISLNAPDIIIRNEKRMLQEATDALFDNAKKKKAVRGAANRPLRSLSDLLRGKQGRFRQNLLGKRVDYSARSVIVVGPDLKLNQCGLPIKMALELFKPFVMRRLVEKEIVYNIKRAKMVIEQESEEIWPILQEVVRNHPVLLNRAPTLHRLGIQAFEPVLIEGKAIRLHPLVCHAFNADFDGDQMAVHVPLTAAAQAECYTLMLSSKNLLNPANGYPIVFPSQDMVLGIGYLTRSRKNDPGEGLLFSSFKDVRYALDNKRIGYHSIIKVVHEGKLFETTAGRVLFNEILPKGVDFVNYVCNDKELKKLISVVYQTYGTMETVEFLDRIKSLGFKYATLFGATIGIDDVIVPQEKKELIESGNNQVEKIQKQYLEGVITGEERYNKIVSLWTQINDDLTTIMMETLKKDKDGFNVIYLMAETGARGSKNQIRQLAGMRGLMARPSGEIIELPIRSNFKEGLSVIEFFISSNGARKGLADTALKTADAGYLTRRLVDIAQDVVVMEEDCGTINGIEVKIIKRNEEIIESMRDRILGQFSLEPIRHPISGDILVDFNQEITEELVSVIEKADIERILIRSVLTCDSSIGVCQGCYGRNLATGKLVNIGEAVGITAAQSIGQPGTQLTMRTFHIGGVASTASEENKIVMNYPFFVENIEGFLIERNQGEKLLSRKGFLTYSKILDEYTYTKKDKILVSNGDKVVRDIPLIQYENGEQLLSTQIALVRIEGNKLYLVAHQNKLELKNGSNIYVEKGQLVKENEIVATFDTFSDPIIAEVAGIVRFVDILKGRTLKSEINLETNLVEQKIVDANETRESEVLLDPLIRITSETGEILASYVLPQGAYLSVQDGDQVGLGTIIAKLSKESERTQDITGGLPRVGELFEARAPKEYETAILARVSGVVEIGTIIRKGYKTLRKVIVRDVYGKDFEHLVYTGRPLLVRTGDKIEVGEMISAGVKNPHDVLNILGESILESFIMDEIQEIYRRQGVNIHDKHIGVIIRQMVRKVEIIEVGDTNFIYGQQINKHVFREKNTQIRRQGGEPAFARSLLLGITRASLNIESFISAASFQETTKILTNAAIQSKVDTLQGLKENVVIGQLIPAGTGFKKYRNLRLYDEKNKEIDYKVKESVQIS